MKVVGVILFILLLVPIYVLPWVSVGSSAVAAMAATDAPIGEVDEQAAFHDIVDFMKFWIAEGICYVLLLAVTLVFARGARWTAALIAFAAAFDLLPILDFIPFVPTVMFILAFVFMAKARPPHSGMSGAVA